MTGSAHLLVGHVAHVVVLEVLDRGHAALKALSVTAGGVVVRAVHVVDRRGAVRPKLDRIERCGRLVARSEPQPTGPGHRNRVPVAPPAHGSLFPTAVVRVEGRRVAGAADDEGREASVVGSELFAWEAR